MTDVDTARRALEDVCARGDLDAAREVYSDDFVDHVNGREFRGQEGIAHSTTAYREIFDDLRIAVDDQIHEGDRVASRWTLTGAHRGRPVSFSGITVSRFENGRIAEDWSVSDAGSLLRQLGPRRSLALMWRWRRT